MSSYIELKDSKFLRELSEQEQETIAGGSPALADLNFDWFYFQQTDIRSKADSETKFDVDGKGRGSSSGSSDYELSQTTLAFGRYPESSSRRISGSIIGGILNLIFGFF